MRLLPASPEGSQVTEAAEEKQWPRANYQETCFNGFALASPECTLGRLLIQTVKSWGFSKFKDLCGPWGGGISGPKPPLPVVRRSPLAPPRRGLPPRTPMNEWVHHCPTHCSGRPELAGQGRGGMDRKAMTKEHPRASGPGPQCIQSRPQGLDTRQIRAAHPERGVSWFRLNATPCHLLWEPG